MAFVEIVSVEIYFKYPYEEVSMYCEKCGQANTGDNNYCEKCGNLLKKPSKIQNSAPKPSNQPIKTQPTSKIPNEKPALLKPKKKKKHVGLFIFLFILAIPVVFLLAILFYFIMGHVGPFDAPRIRDEIALEELDLVELIQMDEDYDLIITLEYDTINSLLYGLIDGDMIPNYIPIGVDDLFIDTDDVRIFINIKLGSINIPISFEPEIDDDGRDITLSINSIKYSKFNLPITSKILNVLPDDALEFNKEDLGLPQRFEIKDFESDDDVLLINIDMDYVGIIEDMRENFIDEELLADLSKMPHFAEYANILNNEDITDKEIGKFISDVVFGEADLNFLLSPFSSDTVKELIGSTFYESTDMESEIEVAIGDITR